MSDMIAQFVYYYPPSNMTAQDISGIGGDGYYGLIAVNIDLGSIGGSQYVFMPNANSSGQIFLTPEAFTNWYNDNLTSASQNQTIAFLATSAEQPVNGFANMNAETGNYLQEQGFYWKPYDPNYMNSYQVAQNAIDPVKQYGFTSSELYMLIRTEASTNNATGTNGLATTTSLTQGALQNQASQQQSSITNQTQNTQSGAQIVATGVSNAASSIGSAASAPLNTLAKDIEIGLIGLGIFALAGIAIYAYVSKKA
jgi:hypothetical protein